MTENEIREKYPPTPSCSCSVCQEMCVRPCWPMPSEAKAIIDAGFAMDMMEDYWTLDDGQEIKIISPACVGYSGERAPFIPKSPCVLQMMCGKCELHELGLKPLEAKASDHTSSAHGLHGDIAQVWDTDEGRAVVDLWHRTVRDFTDNSAEEESKHLVDNGPSSLYSY